MTKKVENRYKYYRKQLLRQKISRKIENRYKDRKQVEIYLVYELYLILFVYVVVRPDYNIQTKDILQQINKQRGILCNTLNVFQALLPFYATQIITPFLNSKISVNCVNGQGFQPIVKLLCPLMFLQFRISFIQTILHHSHRDNNFQQKRFYNRETLMGIRISRLVKSPYPLS